jgi:hypothetical protein
MLDDRPAPERERQQRPLDPAALGPAGYPVSPAVRRRRRWTLVAALIIGLAGGTGLSVIPRPARDVLKTGNSGRFDFVPRQWIQVRHGYPFAVWTVETTPPVNDVVNDKRINVSPSGAILNFAVATFLALLVVVPKRRDPEDSSAGA